MKKLVVTLITIVALGISTYAQKKGNFDEMNVEQKTMLAVKRMTLKLDLTKNQQEQIKPLLAQQISERKAMRKKHKEMRKSKKRPTANERYKMLNAKLDDQIAFKNKMKTILNQKQYEKFEKHAGKIMHKMKHKLGKKRKNFEPEKKI